jgi:hypothetical protein
MNISEQFPQQKKEITNNYRANINDWADVEREYNKDFADNIDEKRSLGSENLEKFNLKRFKHAIMPLADFLKNKHEILKSLDSDIFYISLQPKKDGLKRQGKTGLTEGEVLKFISNFVSEGDIENYDIAANQMFPNIFGGSTIIDQKGNVYFEFIEGNQTAVSKGNAEIKYVVFRDSFMGSFKYSFEDEVIRSIALDAIMNIPHKGEGREMRFMPGYYEMVIAQRNEDSKPEPFFLDYRDNDAYQIDWERAAVLK